MSKKTCLVVVIIVIIFFGCGVLYFNVMWYRAWHSTPEEVEASENKRMLQSIETANQTGRLELYPDFWYSAPEFYATKQFQMIHNLKGIRSFFCCGYPKIPVPAESVAAISTLKDLEEISLMNMRFEEGVLLTLQELPKLHKISFYGCHVDVASLQHIGQFKSVESLTILCPMPFTGSNQIAHQIDPEMQRRIVETLCQFTHLKNLELQECFRCDLETLRQYLPDTDITFEEIGLDMP